MQINRHKYIRYYQSNILCVHRVSPSFTNAICRLTKYNNCSDQTTLDGTPTKRLYVNPLLHHHRIWRQSLWVLTEFFFTRTDPTGFPPYAQHSIFHSHAHRFVRISADPHAAHLYTNGTRARFYTDEFASYTSVCNILCTPNLLRKRDPNVVDGYALYNTRGGRYG